MNEGISNQKEALQYLIGLGEATPSIKTIHDHGDSVTKLIIQGNGRPPEIEEFDKPTPPREHSFDSLTGFLEFLQGPKCGDDGAVVFIGNESVVADLNYQGHVKQRAKMVLDKSDEFSALLRTMNINKGGMTQEFFWRMLATSLDGHIADDSLYLSISDIRIVTRNSDHSAISDIGIKSQSTKRSIEITYPAKGGADDKRELALDHVFSGKIFDCLETEYEIKLRLEAIAPRDGGLGFIFHPKKLNRVIGEAKQEIVEVIRKTLNDKKFCVYEGNI